MKKNLTLYFLHTFFGNLDFSRGLFVLFLMSRHISLTEIGVLQTLLFLSNIIFEVPAGILADKFKRKYSVAFGLSLIATAAFIVPLSYSFTSFALAFILHGMGFAFRSGADTALLFDELKSAGSTWASRFVSLSAHTRSLINIALVIAMAAGGFILGELGWVFVYGLFGTAMVIAAGCTLAISESSHHSSATSHRSMPFKEVVAALRQFFSTRDGRAIAFFIFGMGFIEATHSPIFIYIQTYFKDSGLADSKISLVIALSLALTSVGYFTTNQLKKISIDRLVLISGVLLILLIGLFLLRPPLIVGIILFAVIDMLPSLLFVHSDNHINEKLPSKIRASLLSFHSLVSALFISITFLSVGRLLDFFPSYLVLGSLSILPLLGLISLGLYFRNARHHKMKAEEWNASSVL